MTHLIPYKTLVSARLKEAAQRTKSNARQLTFQMSPMGSTLIGNKACFMPPLPHQTHWLWQNRAAFLNSNSLSHLVIKGFLHTDVTPSAAQPLTRGEAKPPKGNAYQSLARGPLNNGAASLPSLARHSLASDARNAQPVDYRLLTGKLGGWGHGSPIGGGSAQGVGVKAFRQKVSLHIAPRPLPGYLVKLVNQLMRDGKKGVSIGLLADSLTLFCKRLEEGRRSKLHNGGVRSAILPNEGDGQGLRTLKPNQGLAPRRTGCIALQCRKGAGSPPKAIEPQGVLAFPFCLASFPGPSSGEMLLRGGGKLSTLLPLPFSGALLPHFSITRVSFVKRGGEHRGLLGFEASQGHAPRASQGVASRPQCRRGAEAPLSPCPKDAPLDGFGVLLNGLQSLNAKKGLGRDSSLARAEVGLRFHTKRPLYFWPVKGRTLHSKGIKAQTSQASLASQGFGVPLDGFDASLNGSLSHASTLSYLGRAISNIEPSLEVRKKKIAGITRQIPCVVSKVRGERLAIRWIINSARDRVKKRGKGLAYCLAEELVDAYYKRGEPRQRRDSLHKVAESNRSFLRYRWW